MLAVVAGAPVLLAVTLPSRSGIDWRHVATAVGHVPVSTWRCSPPCGHRVWCSTRSRSPRPCHAWGFGRRDFATYTLVTNVWDVLVKLCRPAITLAWLLASGGWPRGRS